MPEIFTEKDKESLSYAQRLHCLYVKIVHQKIRLVKSFLNFFLDIAAPLLYIILVQKLVFEQRRSLITGVIPFLVGAFFERR